MYNPTSYVDWGLWDKHFCWESSSTNFAWSNYNTVYSILCKFLLKQVTSVYLSNTHFTRTGCNSSQVCTEGSKDPNHQCINIALILCFNQLHCYVGGKQGPQLSVQMNIPCCRLCCIVQCHTHITPVAPSCTKLRTTQCRGFVDFLEIKCDRKWNETWWLPGDL